MIQPVTDERVVIIGAGGHGREAVAIAAAVRASGRNLETVGVLDDGDPDTAALRALGTQHLGGVEWLADADAGTAFVAALGYPGPRRMVADRAQAVGARAAVLVHPTASIGPDVTLGEGVVIWPQVTVTTRVRLGRHTHLNVGSSVSHDCTLGDYVTVGPGARICGSTVLEDDVWIGAGAAVIQGIRIGRGAVVGAGSVVITDVPPATKVAGVPARSISSGEA
jgi:sugar O-acyltransferase (sialic acid O-acetyltransferase NeuD family)